MNSLATFLEMAVPLRIMELERQGGPTDYDREQAREFGAQLASEADRLMYRGKRGESGKLAGRLACAVAVAAFCPGGVKLMGLHFTGTMHQPPNDAAQEETASNEET